MTTQQLNLADKTTLWAWRALNVIGWSLGALLVAGVVAFGVEALFVDVLDAMGVFDPWLFSPFGEWLQAIMALALVGMAMGAVIGSRVYRWPGFVAGLVSALFSFVLPGLLFTLPFRFLGGPAFWIWGSALVAIAVATSRWTSHRRRPTS